MLQRTINELNKISMVPIMLLPTSSLLQLKINNI